MPTTASAVWGTGHWNSFNWGAVDAPLTGSISSVSSVSGVLRAAVPVTTQSCAAVSSTSGAFTVVAVFSGASAGVSSVSGSFVVPVTMPAVTAGGVSSTAGSPSATTFLTGSAAAGSVTSGALTAGSQVTLAGAAAVSVATTGVVTVAVQLGAVLWGGFHWGEGVWGRQCEAVCTVNGQVSTITFFTGSAVAVSSTLVVSGGFYAWGRLWTGGVVQGAQHGWPVTTGGQAAVGTGARTGVGGAVVTGKVRS